MSEDTTVWFRQSAQNGEDASMWHASNANGRPHGYCGFSPDAMAVYERVVLPIGELPVDEPGRDDVCLHCQRALEMARRDGDE